MEKVREVAATAFMTHGALPGGVFTLLYSHAQTS